MRQLLPILAVFTLIGCPQPTSFPLEVCSTWEGCAGEFDCIGFHCIARCTYEGDCDNGFRCNDGQCLQACSAQEDCTIGECGELGDGRRGNACFLTNLPECGVDDDCGWGLCIQGRCASRCDWVGACDRGEICDFVRGDYGTCVAEPNQQSPAVSP